MAYAPEVGHIIKLDLDPVIGHEQGGWRPAVVLSPLSYNRLTSLVIAVPVTSKTKGYPFEVRLPSGLKTTGVVLADQIKNLDWRSRRTRYVEMIPPEALNAIRERLTLLLGFMPT